MNSKTAIAEMRFVGHGNLGSVLGISTYPVLRFVADGDSIYFNGNINMDLKKGDEISVRYQGDNHSDARINTFLGIWMDSVSYALLPFLILLVIYIMPERLDPIIPKKSKIILGRKPFLQVIKPVHPK